MKKNFAGKKVCSFGQSDDFGTDGVQGVELTSAQGALATKQTYTPTNTNVGPADRRAAGGRLPGRRLLHRARFHRLEIGTARSAQLQAAVRRLQRRLATSPR